MQNGPPVSPIAVAREALHPIHVGTQQQPRTFTVNFVVKGGNPTEATIMGLLGALRPGDPNERVMVAEITDGPNSGVEVECLMAVGQWRMGVTNDIYVDFTAADPRWFERVAVTLPEIAISHGDAMPLPNDGGADVDPVLRFGWDTQRASTSATVGWKYIKQETITNSGTKNWRRVRMTVDLGDTAALVTAGKMQADGDDLRVRISGQPSTREIQRTLTNPNTKRTLCHFYVTIPAGQSVTYDFVYGNASATAPTNLSTRTRNALSYAADDLEGDSGTATSGGANTLTDSGATWETNRWRYGYIQVTGGTGSGQRRWIASNTGTVITTTRNWTTQPDNTSTYEIWMTGIAVDGGRATSLGTTTTMQDTNQAWGTNQWQGGVYYNITQGIGPYAIVSNTADTITTATMSAAPALNDSYYLERYGVIQYMVNRSVTETAHRGLWRINKYHSKGAKVWYGDQVPGGWIPWLMLANNDDYAQGRYIDEGSGGGHAINNWPGHYSRRAVRSDNTWPEEGQADGALFHDPRALVGLDWDYQMKNEGGIGQVVILTQEPDGDDWQTVGSDTTTRSTLANVTAGSGVAGYTNLTGDQTPNKLYIGVWPADGVEIPSTKRKDYSVELRNHAKMMLYLDVTDCGSMTNGIYVVGSETEVYDLQATFRIGGGSSATPPYDKVAANVLLAANRELWINPDPESGAPLIGVYNSSTDTLVARAPMAATITHHDLDLDGTDTGVVSKTLTPIRPGDNLVPYPDSITGWSLNDGGTGVTATLNNETSTYYGENAQAIRINITAAPVGAWTLAMERANFDVIPGTLYDFGAIVRSSITGIDVSVVAEWQETQAGGATSSVDGTQTDTITIASAARWYPLGAGKQIFAGSSVTPATGGCNLYILIEGTGNVSGNIYIDPITLGVPNLYVSEDEPGTLSFEASWVRSYHG